LVGISSFNSHGTPIGEKDFDLLYATRPSLNYTRGRITMIEALKDDALIKKVGGRFKLATLIQHRLKEIIIDGARPLVEREGKTDLEIVIEEIMQDKIEADWSEAKSKN
tara:strand:- start:396 stop:722 length:327 start_codon:yes stop_codon:yes gene_type:complete